MSHSARLVCAVALLVFAPAAHAQDAGERPRVGVGPVTGLPTAGLQSEIGDVLLEHSRDIVLVTALEYGSTARRMNVADAASDPDLAHVAQSLNLDAFFVGAVERRGARAITVRVRVLRGSDGTTLGRAAWELASIADMESIRGQIWEQLHWYIRVDPARGAPVPSTVSSTTSATTEARSQTGVPATPGLGVLTVGIAGGGALRDWSVTVLGEPAPRHYANGGYAEGGADAMLLYRSNGDRFGAGISGGVTLPLAIASYADDAMGRRVALATSSLEVWGGAALAYRPPGGGWVRLDLGAFDHAFSVDTSMLPVTQRLPPVSYLGFRASAEAIVPLLATADWEFGLLFGAEIRVAEANQELRNAFGLSASYVTGIGGEAGISLRLDGILTGLGVRATAWVMRYRTSFAGPAAVGPASDSIDDYLRSSIAVTYALGTRRVVP